MIPREAPTGRSAPPDSLVRPRGVPLQQRIAHLVEAMRRCVASGEALDFGEPSHREITEALRIVAYAGGELRQPPRRGLKVVYGSEPSRWSIPVDLLVEVPGRLIERQLHVGTLSFRHLDYDDRIDLYLIRDRETRRLSSSEVDELAYERMKAVVTDPYLRRGEAGIVLFQTGLAPLVAGVYRAVIEELLERTANGLPRLEVQPVFFADGDKMARGRRWG